jgi:type I restriction-modification system DNA methylase subunit
LTQIKFPRTLRAVPASGKEKFFAKLDELIASAKDSLRRGFDLQEPEEATKQKLLEPLLQALGFTSDSNYIREFKIIGDSVDYLLKSNRPLIFLEAKSLLDKSENLFIGHREQVQRYIRNYRVSPEQVSMERPVTWIVLTNFAQFHFIRVNEEAPTFSFTLDDLWKRREEFWELLALENLETGHIEELYEQRHKAGLDQRFLVDLKRWRLLLANGFALRNQKRSLDDITLASQQLLNRFLFSRMLETNQLIEWNKLARAYSHYEVIYEGHSEKTFAEFLRESLFQEIKFKFNTELFEQPLLCDTLALDNKILSILVGHEPLSPDVAATCGFDSGQGELLAFRHLYSYDFSLMSSDVMGAVYEKFLAHKLSQSVGRIVIEDTDELRKKEGIYYTPRYIVDYIVAHTLGEKIKPVLAEAKTLLGYKNYKGAYDKICELSQIKVLDPAMGSGSFLLGAFDALVSAYNDYNAECEKQKRNGGGNGHDGGGALFDAPVAKPRPVERLGTAVVTHNLFGVDLDAQAVEVAKLNLWIRLMAAEKDSLRHHLTDPRAEKKPRNLLPALSANFKRGNSLIDDAKVAGDAAFDWKKQFPEIMGSARVSRAESGVAPDSSAAPIKKSVKQSFRRDAENDTPEACALQTNCGFDVVIGNPPYERIQTMMGNAPQAVEFLKTNYRSGASGNFDIYVCFIERGLELLNADGFFGYICPHKFFQAEYGVPVRKLLSEGKHVRHVVSFGDQQIFPQVSTYTCLLHLAKKSCEAVDYAEAELEKFAVTHETAPPFKVPAISLSAEPWNFLSATTTKWMEKAAAAGKLLSELTKEVFVGLQTSADDVFLFEAVETNKSFCTVVSESLGKSVKLEAKLLKPVIRSGEIGRFWAKPTHLVLFPYTLRDGKAQLLAETELSKKFPLAWDYLSQNKAKLEARENGKFAKKGWWQLYPKNLEFWESPKILVPYMIQRLAACYDTDDNYFVNVTTGGFGLRFGSEQQNKFVCGLLNSSLLDAYLKQISTNFRGGYFAANKQFLDKLPIKLIDPKKKSEVKLEKEIVERVGKIQTAHKQRLKLPEVLQKKILHTQNRTACNLAHYLQKDFADSLKHEILIADVQQTGFVHEIKIESAGSQITLSASVANSPGSARASPAAVDASSIATDDGASSATRGGACAPQPILRLTFKDDALRQFIYASWRQFLDDNSRKKKWTTGKKPEAIYPLIVNTLEPLVYFSASAGDNLRAIRDLMKTVAEESGGADLAAIESEIEKLDTEIDARVYELYGLTADEIKIVEGTGK